MSIYAQEVKIGIVNAQEIMQNSFQGKEIERELLSVQEEKKAEMKSLENQIKALEKVLLGSPNMDHAERQQRETELQDLRIHLKRKYEDAQNEISKLSMQRLSELEKEIMPLIDQIGKEMGFTLILDVTQSGIVYFDQSIDITQQVVLILDERTR
jgi:outer membrane protein